MIYITEPCELTFKPNTLFYRSTGLGPVYGFKKLWLDNYISEPRQ